MTLYYSWVYPNEPPAEIAGLLFENDKKLVIVGIIGKSAFDDCNKMLALNVLNQHPSTLEHEPKEGQIEFYYNCQESMLLLHFYTSFDAGCMQRLLQQQLAQQNYGQFLLFSQCVRNRFARMLLFATQVCHIIVFVELSVTFDASLLAIFKALKIIREKYVLKFLPKLLKNSSIGNMLGKAARFCSPRILFLFENYPNGYEKNSEAISKLEFEVEDNIYKMLRMDFIITNNNAHSLFSIASNKRFVYYNTNEQMREDPLLKSVGHLEMLLEKSNFKEDDDDDLNDLMPYPGFGRTLAECNLPATKQLTDNEKYLKERQFMHLLKSHVKEALSTGFDDNTTMKYRSKSHFVLLSAKAWFETFTMLHKIFIENPSDAQFEANDIDYQAYLENFDKLLNIDNDFFNSCCEIGLQKAFAMYNNPALTHYSAEVHKTLLDDAVGLYMKYARGPNTAMNANKLREMCENCWQNGKLQCEAPSLRGNPCMLPKHIVQDAAEHNSGRVFISTCNCGRTQGRREDPYTMRQANYEFYEFLAKNCNLCAKVKKIHFAIFEPSSNDYRAAAFEASFPRLPSSNQLLAAAASVNSANSSSLNDNSFAAALVDSQPMTHTNLSLESTDNLHKIAGACNSSTESLNELVLQLKDSAAEEQEEESERNILRQPSTTEYLPGMVHTASPAGVLPQFASWSLVCVGASSVYSHNTGLLEHFQSGFLTGSNFLLPWDVHVRLEHSANWAAAYEKTRYRKMGEVFKLKIFVGCEYECPRGHRFMMCTPDKVLRGGSGIMRDSGSKIVYNNMPLYFGCPCHTHKSDVAQLMRVHVVTPKAPVNVMLDPKVHVGEYVFTLGLTQPAKLTQSAYWILRLPYIYQADDVAILPPAEVNATTAINYGYLRAGMFGVTETELDD